VEVYLNADEGKDVGGNLLSHWALETHFKLSHLNRIVDVRKEEEVVDHLVRLSAGLESMLVGETQILGQIKSTLAAARANGAADQLLSDVFDRAIAAGSRIREQTGIGRGAVSLGSAAVQLAETFLGTPSGWRVLVVGTGQAAMLTVKS